MNWYIFAFFILGAVIALVLGWFFSLGYRKGHAEGYECGTNDARDNHTEHERIAYNNGEISGFQRGREFQQAVQANRAREAVRRDGAGRFKKTLDKRKTYQT